MRLLFVLALCLAAVAAVPKSSQKIVGGTTTTISQYPHMVSLLYSWNWVTYWQACGGSLLNTRSILTAAHCVVGDAAGRWRIRVGSTYANSGGTVYQTQNFVIHPNYNVGSRWNNDVAVMRSATIIAYVNNAVQPALIAGTNYNLADNQAVWASGWGTTTYDGASSETLRHVQIWTVNQNTCATRYQWINTITPGMLCSGWLDVGGRDQCQGDSGGPLHHNGVVVGVCSWGQECALAYYPGVNARVSAFTTWIQANA